MNNGLQLVDENQISTVFCRPSRIEIDGRRCARAKLLGPSPGYRRHLARTSFRRSSSPRRERVASRRVAPRSLRTVHYVIESPRRAGVVAKRKITHRDPSFRCAPPQRAACVRARARSRRHVTVRESRARGKMAISHKADGTGSRGSSAAGALVEPLFEYGRTETEGRGPVDRGRRGVGGKASATR